MNTYVEGGSVFAKEYQNGEVELCIKTASKTNEHSENVGHEWVYTLAKGDAEADEELPDTYAEANLSDERFRQSFV